MRSLRKQVSIEGVGNTTPSLINDRGRPLARSSCEALAHDIAACRLCRDAPRFGGPLPHEPRPVVRLSAHARILVAGQAPGTRVHETGLPFNDRSGDRLRDWMGIDRATFYDSARIAIVPMGFCFPGHDAKGGDLPPRRECRETWHDRIMPLLAGIQLILAIGRAAQDYHLRRLGRMLAADLAGIVQASLTDRTTPRVLCLPHPSWRNTGWLKRHPFFETDMLPVLRRAVADLL
jgi:uracil-DNA glycosylase